MRLSRDNLIVLGIVVVITVTYVAVIYRWQARTLEDVRVSLAERQRGLRSSGMTASRVPGMVREIEAMKQRYNTEWDRRLPKRKELAEFLREISSNLARERLMNQIIQPGNPTRSLLYNRLPITMKFEGGFLSLGRFLKRVDHMTRLTRIEKMVIEPSKDSRDLAIELGMNIYFTEQ